MKKLALLSLLLLLPAAVYAQNINGRFSASVYTFERYFNASESETYIRNYEALTLNINKNQFSLRTRLSFETNFSNTLDADPRLRFYNLYLEGRDLFDVATVKLGRQPFFSSIGGGVYDAANLKLDFGRVRVHGFFGGNVPAYQKMEFTDDFANDRIIGAKVTADPVENMFVELSFVDKNVKAIDYTTLRLDMNNDPITQLIQSESNQYRFGSAKASYRMPEVFDVYARYDYDLNYMTTSKFEVSARYDQVDRLGINLYYNYRAPKLAYNSIFAVFNYANTQEVEAGVDYEMSENITLLGKFANVTYEDDNAQRLTVGVNMKHINISYRKTLGVAGELDAVSVYGAHSFFEGLLTPSLGFSYTSYKLNPDDADTDNITSLLAGCNLRPFKTWTFDLQAQYFDTRVYQNDLRLLFKINHWFNSNLKLF